MCPGDFVKVLDELYFNSFLEKELYLWCFLKVLQNLQTSYIFGKFPYEKCQICVSSQKHYRKTTLEECAPKAFSWYDVKNIYVKKIGRWKDDVVTLYLLFVNFINSICSWDLNMLFKATRECFWYNQTQNATE